jgi:hypothetical protein
MLEDAAPRGRASNDEIERAWQRGRSTRRRRRAFRLATPALVLIAGVVMVAPADDRGDDAVVATRPSDLQVPDGATRAKTGIAGVDELRLGGGLAVRMVVGGASITVEAEPDVMDDVSVEVRDGVATVDRSSPLARANETVVVTVAVESVRRLTVDGGVLLDGEVSADNLVLRTSGGIAGTLRGRVDLLALDASGGVQLDLTQLAVERLIAVLSGGTTIDVDAAVIERATLSGGSVLSYPSGAVVGDTDVDISSVLEPR